MWNAASQGGTAHRRPYVESCGLNGSHHIYLHRSLLTVRSGHWRQRKLSMTSYRSTAWAPAMSNFPSSRAASLPARIDETIHQITVNRRGSREWSGLRQGGRNSILSKWQFLPSTEGYCKHHNRFRGSARMLPREHITSTKQRKCALVSCLQRTRSSNLTIVAL